MIVRKICLYVAGAKIAEYRSYTIPREGEIVELGENGYKDNFFTVESVHHSINMDSRNEDHLAEVALIVKRI